MPWRSIPPGLSHASLIAHGSWTGVISYNGILRPHQVELIATTFNRVGRNLL